MVAYKVKKHQTIGIWLSDVERTKLSEAAARLGVTKGKALKAVFFEATLPTPRKIVTADPNLVRQLAYIGNNINQLTYQANKASKSGELSDALFMSLLIQLTEVTEQLETLRKVFK